MPTGYTEALYEGKPQTFAEFAMLCARGMGALILLRDESLDAEIPARFEPELYSWTHMNDAREKIAEVGAWSDAEAGRLANESWEKAHAEWKKAQIWRGKLRQRYEAMLAEVRDWTPPTGEHTGLKKFMTEQLEKSIEFDCADMGEYLPEPQVLPASEYRAERLAQYEKDLRYHAKQWTEELERTDGRNKWLQALRESLRKGDNNE